MCACACVCVCMPVDDIFFTVFVEYGMIENSRGRGSNNIQNVFTLAVRKLKKLPVADRKNR